jgi:hypothetical protein
MADGRQERVHNVYLGIAVLVGSATPTWLVAAYQIATPDERKEFWTWSRWPEFIPLAVAALLFVALVRGWRLPGMPKPQPGFGGVTSASTASPSTRDSGDSLSLLKAKGTNDGTFPRIESAVDSLGHTVERGMNDDLSAHTDFVLRPGQEVSFELEVTDPNGDDVYLSVITPGGPDADVAISNGVVTWKVRDADIADPAHVHIYVKSQRSYHRVSTFDDAASFIYRVLPRAT